MTFRDFSYIKINIRFISKLVNIEIYPNPKYSIIFKNRILLISLLGFKKRI